MADQITPKSLNIHSRTERPRADARLEIAGEKNTVLGNALYQVNWIVRTGRLNGTAEMAVRALSGYQFAKLVCHVANEGLLDSAITRYIYVFLGMDNDTPPAVQPETTEAQRPGLTPATLGEYATHQEAPVDYAPPVYSDFEMIDPYEDYDSYIARKERESLINPDNAHIGTWDYDDAVAVFEANLPSPDPVQPTPSHTTVPRTSPAPTITGHGRSARQHKQAKQRTRRGARQQANMQRRKNSPRPIRIPAQYQQILQAITNLVTPVPAAVIATQFYALRNSQQVAKEVDLTAAFRAAYSERPTRFGKRAA